MMYATVTSCRTRGNVLAVRSPVQCKYQRELHREMVCRVYLASVEQNLEQSGVGSRGEGSQVHAAEVGDHQERNPRN